MQAKYEWFINMTPPLDPHKVWSEFDILSDRVYKENDMYMEVIRLCLHNKARISCSTTAERQRDSLL